MQSADPINTPIKAFRPRQEYVMPDVITVRVETGKFVFVTRDYYKILFTEKFLSLY